nr:immunoglobulin heavy chain junction region [Mus musculus]MBK4184865.1 immunoglobulin heavy chain junction region [Mus musculus]
CARRWDWYFDVW